MEDKRIDLQIAELKERHQSSPGGLFRNDFLLTWQKSTDDIITIQEIAQILKSLREENISPRLFDSGMAVSQFRDKSTRTRFSFTSACNFLGLSTHELEESKSQIAHGETVRETANMISFMTEVIGIRDDMFIGRGNSYMQAVSEAVQAGYRDKVLAQRPSVVNLQCDKDHPTQTLADLHHLVRHFGDPEKLRGKKVAMTWAYSPSYGKPLSVPQGIIALFTRFGMNVTLAHPNGYSLMPEVLEKAREYSRDSGGEFNICESMEDAFKDTDVVYPKSWAPFAIMEERTALAAANDEKGLSELEEKCLQNNRKFRSWECNENLMTSTNKALYLHCLPADISNVSCEQGEVSAEVFERFRIPLYRQAGYKPYIIAAIIAASRIKNLPDALSRVLESARSRLR